MREERGREKGREGGREGDGVMVGGRKSGGEKREGGERGRREREEREGRECVRERYRQRQTKR